MERDGLRQATRIQMEVGAGRTRALVNGDGARPAIPTQRHEAPVARPDFIYPNRNWGERLWAQLKK